MNFLGNPIVFHTTVNQKTGAVLSFALTCVLVGCATPKSSSRFVLEPDVNIKQYKYVAIYDAESVSFLEQSLAQLFRDVGFKVVGEKEAGKFPENTVLGVRYTSRSSSLRVLFEDFTTDRTVLTIEGWAIKPAHIMSEYWSVGDEEEAWNQVAEQLRSILSK